MLCVNIHFNITTLLMQMMVCSPHLYNTETTSDQGISSALDESGLDDEAIDTTSDVEDLDDMRHGIFFILMILQHKCD